MEVLKYNAEYCKAILREKHELLLGRGQRRFPKRDDFTEAEIVAIKAFLGPWPRALEAAGVKPPRSDGKQDLVREKRISSKRRRLASLKLNKEEK